MTSSGRSISLLPVMINTISIAGSRGEETKNEKQQQNNNCIDSQWSPRNVWLSIEQSAGCWRKIKCWLLQTLLQQGGRAVIEGAFYQHTYSLSCYWARQTALFISLINAFSNVEPHLWHWFQVAVDKMWRSWEHHCQKGNTLASLLYPPGPVVPIRHSCNSPAPLPQLNSSVKKTNDKPELPWWETSKMQNTEAAG